MPKEEGYVEDAMLDYEEGTQFIAQKLPRLMRKYQAFTDTCFTKGKLAVKDKQLMALAVSVALRDEYCILSYTKACIDENCTDSEILEAVSVAAAFCPAPAMSQAATLIRDALDTFESQDKEEASE
ncbi:carboxymuconolactone decarboxylase family protein [Geomicrobium sp. JSM 1781026]|uniref:carboxymuconolactone decarboxylase family protein n=1 Tax=Geomicrobium sp. JSM 1781026 TaxID=3344580 RepID=UPI0035BFF9D6